jgi:hypothetical protein
VLLLLLALLLESISLYAGYLFPKVTVSIDGGRPMPLSSDDDRLLGHDHEPNNAKVEAESATNATATTLATDTPVAAVHDLVNLNSTDVSMLEQMTLKFASNIQHLRNLTLRYYVYDNWSALKLINHSKVLTNEQEPYVFSALLSNNSWRVTDPSLADLFFAPTPLAAYVRLYPEVRSIMLNLTGDPIFRQYQGHRHVLFALNGRWFDAGNETLSRNTRFFNRRWGRRLENVSVARAYDAISCQKLANDQQDYGDWNQHFSTFRPISKYTFSTGSVAGASIPLVPASYEKFQRAKYILFFHTRNIPFMNGSSRYRWAPLNVKLPYNASIGYDLPKDLWWERIMSSKFCLVIRGDDPRSHSLLRSVKVGCIPVVVSDHFHKIAQSFRSSLDMRDFSIFVDEQEFINNPQEKLAALQDIPESVIRMKVIALRYAQQVTCPDHPDSLFLPALLREADASFQPSYPH